jgi:NAD(P)H-hydrate epimerase
MEILTGEQMRRVDRRAIRELGIPSLSLMESAGGAVAGALLEDHPEARTGGVVVLCGKGNNGGDGLVVARHLARAGVRVDVLLLGDPERISEDAAANYGAAREAGIHPLIVGDAADWEKVSDRLDGASLVVDALLGTGVRGGARGLIARAIEELNGRDRVVVSIDLPSGLDADASTVDGTAVRATTTYTLCRPKPALVLEPAAALAGRWRVLSIGIPDAAVEAEGASLEWLDAQAARPLLPPRQIDSHKGRYGHLLAVAGSRGKSGAAVLLARAALRAGAGLVTVATPDSALESVAQQQAEVMTEPLPETKSKALSRIAGGRALELLGARDALAVGPGLGTAAGTRHAVVALVAGRRAPAVVDADGLNAFALGGRHTMDRLRAGRHPLVLTPHPGEAGRLVGRSVARVQADRPATALRLARRTRAVVVLKGHRTLIAHPDGRLAINASGNPGMASAGTGDALTGIVGGFLARGWSAWDAARLAVFVHGDAGDRAAGRLGQEGLIASDLIDELPAALRDLGNARESPRW